MISNSVIQMRRAACYLTATLACLLPITAVGKTIEVSTTKTLTYVGFTTNPLTAPEGITAITTGAVVLPTELREKLGVAPDQRVLILDPKDAGFFWFKGNVEYDDLTIAVSDENGWYGFTREGGSIGGNSMYSVDNIPANSSEFRIHAFRGECWKSCTPITSFDAWESTAPAAAPVEAQAQFPIKIKLGDRRLTIHRVVSGFKTLVLNRETTLRQENYLTRKWPVAAAPDTPYTGIVHELEKPASSGTLSGRLDHLLGDGYVTDSEQWQSHASVKDSSGTTWSSSFRGSRSGWGEIRFMETPLNLPANQGPFTFDLYFTKDTAPEPDLTLSGLVVPEEDKHLDEITTTVKGRKLTIGMAGKMTEVPDEFSFGGFSGPSVLVSSPDPLPSLGVRVTDGAGASKDNNDWNFSTSDELHYNVMSFGGNQEPGDPFTAGTTVTVELTIPETLHFQFKAVPERAKP